MMRTAFVAAAAFAAAPVQADTPVLSPGEIVDAAPAADWVAISPDDLLVMDLAPDTKGRLRRVVIQLMPPPFSQGWIANIRKLAAAHWWDGTSINRVQDNYVVQWGDPHAEDAKKAKPLPRSRAQVPQEGYEVPFAGGMFGMIWSWGGRVPAVQKLYPVPPAREGWTGFDDPYANAFAFVKNFPVAMTRRPELIHERVNGSNGYSGAHHYVPDRIWPVHCYGMVGVGRNMPPDTGSGAELYTVIGHAPRHLDRNIALVGRVIEGIEYLSSLPRGQAVLGFYATAEERVPIVSIRVGKDVADLPAYEFLSTESASFVRFSDARASRRDAFFIHPAGGADICNIPVPVRRRK